MTSKNSEAGHVWHTVGQCKQCGETNHVTKKCREDDAVTCFTCGKKIHKSHHHAKDDGRNRTHKSNSNEIWPPRVQLPVTSVPPKRLLRRLNDYTNNEDREGHKRADLNQEDRLGRNNAGYENANDIHDRMSVTHLGRPIKRPMLQAPSHIAFKKARREVIAFVREFTSR